MGKKTDQGPYYNDGDFTFAVNDDGMLGRLTGFSLDYTKGFITKQLVITPLYD